MHNVKSRFRFGRDCINYLADLFSDDFNSEKHRFPVCSFKSMDAYHSTKKSGANFRKFPWANGSLFLVWKTIIIVRLEFFNDF